MAMKSNRRQLEEHAAEELISVMRKLPREIERLEHKYQDRPVPDGYPDDYVQQAVDAAFRVVVDLNRMTKEKSLVAHIHRFLDEYPILLASPADRIAFAVYSDLSNSHNPFRKDGKDNGA